METKLLQTWESVKNRVHDISGVENPENWMYENVNGIFYPCQEKERENVVDTMFEELDPDWTDEELIEHGWTIKYSVLIGDNGSVDLRDGCGHKVMVSEEEPQEKRKVGFIV